MTQTKSFSVSYDPERAKELGSTEALIIEQRLFFLFERQPSSFVKFIAPCAHKDYIQGTSWTEELGMSAKRFRCAFDKIGRRYSSKTAFLNAEDPFKGRMYAYYKDRKEKKTIFIKNESQSE